MPVAENPQAGSAVDRANAALDAGAGSDTSTPTSPFRIPIRTGRLVDVQDNKNDINDRLPTIKKDEVARFDLSDQGVEAAFGYWYLFSDEERANLANRMWYLGLIKDRSDFSSAYNTWKEAVTHAGRFAMQGREIDPRDMLEMMGDAKSGPGAAAKRQGPTTRRSIDLTNPETAKAWIVQAFQTSMGRAPDDAEIRSLTAALNSQERSNPTITTNTPTKWDDQGNPIDSTTATTGGVDAEAFLRNQIDEDPEAGAHQAAGTLWPALLQALAAGG